MRDALLKEWNRFRHCDKGVTLVEYGVAISLAVTLGALAFAILSTDIGDAMTAAGDEMPSGRCCD